MRKKADNGSGTVCYQESRKAYLAQFTSPAGKRISKRFRTKAEANDWLATQRADAAEGTFIEPSKITVEGWVKEYLETYAKPKVRTKTLIYYAQTAAHLVPIKDIQLQKLTASHVQKFLNTVKISDSGKRRVYRFLKQILEKALALELVKKNIMIAVDIPKYQQPEIETFTKEEIKHLLEWLRTSKRHQRYYPIVLLAACSGCRMGEILGLKITNVFSDRIKIDNSLLEVRNKRYDSPPKTDSGYREISLPTFVIAQLKEAYRQATPQVGGYVFHTATSTPLSPSNVEHNWRRILELAELPHRHFHALRHTHATELLATGIPILEVSHRLGHSKTSHTLDLYGHVIKGYEDKISQEVSAIFL